MSKTAEVSVQTSDPTAAGPDTLLFLDTHQIIEPDVTNVRQWSSKAGDSEAEIKRIEMLAATIEEEGQIQPVRVRAVGGAVDAGGAWGGGTYELVAGRRRKKAIELINAGRKAGEELKVLAVMSTDVQVSDPSAFRQAVVENWHREGLSPMDMYMDIVTARANFDWQGSKGTKKVAEFFKVSPATITQYEMLGKLPEDLQAKVHASELSRDDAFRLAVIANKKGVEAVKQVVAEAEQVAADVDAEADEHDAGTEPHAHETPGEKKVRSKKAKAAKSKAIKRAAREADPDKPHPRTKSEIMEFFTSCYGPAYGHPNGAVHQFVDALEKYAAGALSDRTLYKYWDACVENANKGTAEVKKDDAGTGTGTATGTSTVHTAAVGKKKSKSKKKSAAKKK